MSAREQLRDGEDLLYGAYTGMVPTLHEMFQNDLGDWSAEQEVDFRRRAVGSTGTGQLRVFRDPDRRVRHVAFYIAEGEYFPGLFVALLVRLPTLVPDLSPAPGRVFFFVDAVIPPDEQEEASTRAREKGLHAKFRDKEFCDFMNYGSKPLAFVSHDSRDSQSLVRPLAGRLGLLGCSVWYDEYSLRPGDSLARSIAAGLSETPRCIVVLSRNFFTNPGWTRGEFNTVITEHFTGGGSVLVPVRHGVDGREAAAYSALLGDVIGLGSDLGLDELARRLAGVLKP